MFKYFYAFLDKIKSKLNQKGQGMMEYAMIIAFVAIIAGVALSSNSGLGDAIQGAFSKATQQVNTTAGNNNQQQQQQQQNP